MSSFFDFIRKDNPKSTPPSAGPTPPQPTTPQQTVQSSQQVTKTVQAYSGIGQPPQPPQQQLHVSPTPVPTPGLTATSRGGDIDLMTHLTQRSNRVFLGAQNKARGLQNRFVDSEHLLHGLLLDSEIYKVLTELKIQPQLVEEELNKVYKKESYMGAPQVSPRIKRIIDNSLVIARKLGFEFISPEHILVALYEEGEGVGAKILQKFALKKEDLNKKVVGKKEGVDGEAAKHKSALDEYTINLTEKAKQGLLDPVVERSDVIERVIHILSRRTKNNPALVGEAGVGKTAIVEGLAQKIASKQVPEPLLDKRILQLDLMSIIAGASHRGDFEERMKNLIEEVKKNQGKVILFIDEIHNIVGAGSSGEGALDASNFLKPALARGEMQLIGATTLTEYRKYIEKDPALERRFQPVLVPEPTEEQAIKMLKAIKDKYEAFHRVKIPDLAIDAAVKLSKRYVGDRFLPDKAVDLMDEAASAVRLPLISLPEEIKSLETRLSEFNQELKEAEKRGDKVRQNILQPKIDEISKNLKEKKEQYELKKAQTTSEVNPELIRDIVSRWTGIPVSKITESEVEKLSKLEEAIHQRMINQEEAVSVIAQAVRRGRAGLKSAQRPTGSFIFLGPTGVGKTELAKTLAEILFGQEEAMTRLDMTEYMEKHEVAKLIGAPPGYVGYEEGGKLTEAVRRKPYSVVLFDEVEKAHPDIFNILLQILDDGRLTDNKGRTISFKNTVVICTSNLGTKFIQDELLKQNKKQETITKKQTGTDKKAFAAIREKVLAELRKFFRPELINRFDEIIVFEPLSFEDMVKIVRLQLKSVGKLLEDQDIGFYFADRAIEEIAQIGFDPIFGARPLRRAIQKFIENPISTLIIKGDVHGADTVKVDFKDNEFKFNIEHSQSKQNGKARQRVKLTCDNCKNVFETEKIGNSTTICSKCASKKVRDNTLYA